MFCLVQATWRNAIFLAPLLARELLSDNGRKTGRGPRKEERKDHTYTLARLSIICPILLVAWAVLFLLMHSLVVYCDLHSFQTCSTIFKSPSVQRIQDWRRRRSRQLLSCSPVAQDFSPRRLLSRTDFPVQIISTLNFNLKYLPSRSKSITRENY